MPAVVDKKKCTGCELCIEVCPVEAISLNHEKDIKIDSEECIECGACENECPNEAITVLREATPLPTLEKPKQSSSPKAAVSDEVLATVPSPDIEGERLEKQPHPFLGKLSAFWETLHSAYKRSSPSQGGGEKIDRGRRKASGRGHHHRHGRR